VLTELTALGRVAEALEADARAGRTIEAGAARNIKEGLNEVAADIRAVIDDLHPPVIETLGLEAALEGHVERLRARLPDLKAGLSIEPGSAEGLSSEGALTVYRVALEALANVLRHAGADRLDVDLHRDGAALLLAVEDNGRTVAGDGAPAFAEGRGLAGMRHRAARLGGTVRIERSRFSTGTKVVLSVPLGAASKKAAE
jgi:signal transduction histidine kinase